MKKHPKARAAGAVVALLVAFALLADLLRTGWHYFQSHPVQAVQWLLGAVVLVIIVGFVAGLKIHD